MGRTLSLVLAGNVRVLLRIELGGSRLRDALRRVQLTVDVEARAQHWARLDDTVPSCRQPTLVERSAHAPYDGEEEQALMRRRDVRKEHGALERGHPQRLDRR